MSKEWVLRRTLFSHGVFPGSSTAAAAAVFKLEERPGSGMRGYVPPLPDRTESRQKEIHHRDYSDNISTEMRLCSGQSECQ